jgi:hypothetical protein
MVAKYRNNGGVIISGGIGETWRYGKTAANIAGSGVGIAGAALEKKKKHVVAMSA